MASDRSDVVIVGGGIMGMTIAYQIARRSPLSVIVLEKGAGLGEGSTGSSSAIIRQRYSQTEDVRVARDGARAFRNWSEFTGMAAPRGVFTPAGVVWMMGQSAAAVRADRDRLVAEGVGAAAVGPDELHSRYPALSSCMEPLDLSGDTVHECRSGEAFLIEADAGFFDPTGALEDVADAARRVGVDVRLRAMVVDVETARGAAIGVLLADGSRISAGTVVNAAGPWCNRVNAMVGLELGWELVPTRVQVLYRDLPENVPRPLPVVGDAASGIYFRPEANDRRVLLGSILEEDENEAVDPDDYNRGADRSFLDTKIHALHHRLPDLPHRGDLQGIAGLYTMNHADVHPVVGPTDVAGFVVANGFSGHGFKESPMIGSIVAQWLTGARASFDTDVPIDHFAVERAPIDVADKTVLA